MILFVLVTAFYFAALATDIPMLLKLKNNKNKKNLIIYSIIFLISYIGGILPALGIEMPMPSEPISWLFTLITGIKT